MSTTLAALRRRANKARDFPAGAQRRLGHRRRSTTDAYIGERPEPITPMRRKW